MNLMYNLVSIFEILLYHEIKVDANSDLGSITIVIVIKRPITITVM